MNFNQYINHVDGMYLTLLESGGEDTTALEIGLEEAQKALELLPAELATKLTPVQREQWQQLRASYPQPPTGRGAQQEWLAQVRGLLIRLPG